ncbi:3-methylornithine--L-lysine ligase PylC [Desulforhopalus singaporensis]|uniref:Pyrrolysine biosynthesis protein PylC n=1 Tax=Desulforhopalus singaporensis TaxID=91360 RepID=A0A1H0KI09_9BACT|nr:3-methylornithine--L-lysine ligase PylC [Desulforhopalus singaporensis]SDO55463.1 pyrrolysine biosynthesis protein PylC [Desulforhopalus singaporensis]
MSQTEHKPAVIAVVGGKLQGIEVLYLAAKAGYRTVLLDKNSTPPALLLCDHFVQHHFSGATPVPGNCPEIDLIVPAIEDDEVLSALKVWSDQSGIPLAFDLDAYAISSSKLKSDELFCQLQLPKPKPWPECGFPLLIKPDSDSGSRGVTVCCNEDELARYRNDASGTSPQVMQEYLEGPSYSIEIIGTPGNYLPLAITEIHMDSVYDCKRVTAPVEIPESSRQELEAMAVTLADTVKLKGIMDLEVICHQGVMKPLEIDARFPSQTPIAVYWATGLNMVKILCDIFISNHTIGEYCIDYRRCASFEHILVKDGQVEVLGEHIMATGTPLWLARDFFGADEALTTYRPGLRSWVATMIFTGNSQEAISVKREKAYARIKALGEGNTLETKP